MRILRKLKALCDMLLFDHFTFPIRMAFVFMVIRSFYIDEYNFKHETEVALTYLFGFFFLYVLTSVLSVKRAESSPFFLSDFIEKQINNDYSMRDVLTMNDKRGVYVRNLRVEGINVITTFKLHENPEFIKGRASAFSLVLSSMHLPSQEKLINRLDKIVEEANYMLSDN